MLKGMFAAAALLAGGAAGHAQERGLDLYWIDVEGGAATLIVTPAGESVLIDTGMPGERDPKRIVKAARAAGLERIDHLVTTHFHIDHFGGAADVAAAMPVVNLYDYGIPEVNPDNPNDVERFARQIKPYREMKVEKRVAMQPGDAIPLKQKGTPIFLRCLGGQQQFVPARGRKAEVDCAEHQDKAQDTSDNANSLVFVLSFGLFDMFDGGDLTWNTEAQLVCPDFRVPAQVDVYDVNHHGLDSSNNPLLVRALAPTVAIMSNGTTKGCGPETFKTLKNTPSIQAIYQIHRNLRPDREHNTASEYIANLERDCAANPIKVSVEPDGKAYTVSIPARGQSRRYDSR